MDYKIPEPRLPTFNDVKQGLAGLYDAVRNPPDPSQTAGNIINAARQGDYASALEQGLTMPGVGVGMAQLLAGETCTAFDARFFDPARFARGAAKAGSFGL